MSRTFFTSDTHFGHANIIKYCHRPFLSDADKDALAREGRWHNGDWKGEGSSDHRISQEAVRMMDDTILENINNAVAPDDVLWHLGDFCFGVKNDVARKAREYRDRINCRNVNLVWGNHDNRRAIRDLFSQTFDLVDIEVGRQQIILCHYAMAVFDKSHRGAIQLYGHSHAGAEPWMDAHMPGRRSFDVGVDNAMKLLGAYTVFSIDDVQWLMKSRHGFSMDHHIPRNSKAPNEESLQG